MATILISGGSGLVGRYFCKKLKENGYDVATLSRVKKQNTGIPIYFWDVDKQEIEEEAIVAADYIIHLAGANIADSRWTKKRKQLIINSRVNSCQLLLEKIKEKNTKLKAFISASAIGYYGAINSDKIFKETDPPANDFLGKTCYQWEQTAERFNEIGIRTVKIRMGIILAKEGGALTKMIVPVKMGIGSALGTGKQFMPWIHIDDLCGIYIKAIEDIQMNGAYNAVAPDYVTNRDFIKSLAQVLNKPFWFPNVPAIVMKTLFGSMSEVLLTGSRISSDKIKTAGYKFLYPELESALINLLT
jgi:uncharacterized protein (TIGR01777 family)